MAAGEGLTGQMEMAGPRWAPAELERLQLLQEELAEAIKACGKVVRHGWDARNPLLPRSQAPENSLALARELGHVQAAVAILVGGLQLEEKGSLAADNLTFRQLARHRDEKLGLDKSGFQIDGGGVWKWLHYQTHKLRLFVLRDLPGARPDIELAEAEAKVAELDGVASHFRKKVGELGVFGDAVEFILEDGSRYAWSESNVQYEPVPQDGEAFTLLRKRLSDREEDLEAAQAVARDQEGQLRALESERAERRAIIDRLQARVDRLEAGE